MADEDNGASVPVAPISDPYRMALSKPCWHWTADLNDEKQNVIVESVLNAFYNWRDRQADGNGNVTIGGTGIGLGLLSSGQPPTTIRADDVEPWQCGGPFVNNDIDLLAGSRRGVRARYCSTRLGDCVLTDRLMERENRSA